MTLVWMCVWMFTAYSECEGDGAECRSLRVCDTLLPAIPHWVWCACKPDAGRTGQQGALQCCILSGCVRLSCCHSLWGCTLRWCNPRQWVRLCVVLYQWQWQTSMAGKYDSASKTLIKQTFWVLQKNIESKYIWTETVHFIHYIPIHVNILVYKHIFRMTSQQFRQTTSHIRS